MLGTLEISGPSADVRIISPARGESRFGPTGSGFSAVERVEGRGFVIYRVRVAKLLSDHGESQSCAAEGLVSAERS